MVAHAAFGEQPHLPMQRQAGDLAVRAGMDGHAACRRSFLMDRDTETEPDVPQLGRNVNRRRAVVHGAAPRKVRSAGCSCWLALRCT